jgi:prepilin-type processing-associated H-X9-DG protein
LNFGDISTNVGFLPPRVNQANYTGEIDGAHYWSFHGTGANFLYADGSVHFMAYGLAPATFRQLCTRNGGEVVTPP